LLIDFQSATIAYLKCKAFELENLGLS
jgi:hypothetical protein